MNNIEKVLLEGEDPVTVDTNNAFRHLFGSTNNTVFIFDPEEEQELTQEKIDCIKSIYCPGIVNIPRCPIIEFYNRTELDHHGREINPNVRWMSVFFSYSLEYLDEDVQNSNQELDPETIYDMLYRTRKMGFFLRTFSLCS